MIRRCLVSLLLVAISPLLITCGNTSSEGGVGGSGVSMGRVSQIGSVYVNNIHYNTDNTRFIINGSETNSGQTDISVGMVVHVTGSKNSISGTGIADSLTYDSLLVGPVEARYSSPEKQIKIMGQIVHINDDTVMEDNINKPALTIEQLSVNTIVEVSGYPVVPGEILATRIELKSNTDLFKVSGSVGSVDAANNGFTIGGLTINASASGQTLPEIGDFVRVTSQQPPHGNIFHADSMSVVQTDGLAEDGEEFSLEGVITTPLDPVSHLFSVNGLVVDASATPYRTDVTSLAAGRLVNVEGVMLNNALLADEIDLASSSTEREEIGAVLQNGAVNLSARTVTLMGKTIHITNSTIFENDRRGESTFSLDELQAGDFLQAKVIDIGYQITALKLELENTPSQHNATLEGSPNDLGGGYIEILGVRIDTSGVTNYNFADERIEVSGNYDSATQILTATHIEEDD